MLCQAYDLYINGLNSAIEVLQDLKKNEDFLKYIKDPPLVPLQPSISAFIYRPVQVLILSFFGLKISVIGKIKFQNLLASSISICYICMQSEYDIMCRPKRTVLEKFDDHKAWSSHYINLPSSQPVYVSSIHLVWPDLLPLRKYT